MKRQFLLAIIVILALSISLNSCTNKSNSDNTKDQNSKAENNASETTESTDNTEDKQEEEANINGIYSGSQNISGLELTAKLTISGNRWSASSQLGYDNTEYQNGTVKGTDLYDESGMIKIGYVSGNTARIDGYPSMRK